MQLRHATLPGALEHIEASHELAARLGRSQGRVDVTRLQENPPADWAFPMTVRGALSGALLIGARADGAAYRPEELTQLADSARQIGLTLESLYAAELRRQNESLARRHEDLAAAVQSLSAENAKLKGAAA